MGRVALINREGFWHSKEEHNVRPSLAFQELVVGQLKK